MKDFFRKCDHIRIFLQIWSHLMKKSLMENLFYAVMCIVKPIVLIIVETFKQFLYYLKRKF